MTDDLDEKRKEKKIEELNSELQNEAQMWELGRIDPKGIEINPYMLDVWFFTMRDMLIELGILDEKDLLIMFKTRLLNGLKEIRPIALQAKAEYDRATAANRPTGIIGPDGQPLN